MDANAAAPVPGSVTPAATVDPTIATTYEGIRQFSVYLQKRQKKRLLVASFGGGMAGGGKVLKRKVGGKRATVGKDAEMTTAPAATGNFVLQSMVKEDHGRPLYCVAWNNINPNHADVFASVGPNRATVYRCEADGGMTMLQCHVDDNEEEEFFACAWCKAQTSSNPMLAVAGLTGMIRVLDLGSHTQTVFRNLVGCCRWTPGSPRLVPPLEPNMN